MNYNVHFIGNDRGIVTF